MTNNLQLFRLSPEIWKAADMDDIDATARDMKELCLFKAPFKKLAIEIPWKFLNALHKDEVTDEERAYENCTMMFEYELNDVVENGLVIERFKRVYMTGTDEHHRIVMPRKDVIDYLRDKDDITNLNAGVEMVQLADMLFKILVVLLATKNHEANTTVNRNLIAGKFNKKNAYRKSYPYTTTISIGNITETHSGDSDDPRTVRPHLRRGHIRTQRFGPDLAFEKKVFIEPVFVNASQGWIAKRAAYNVSGKAWSDLRANAS